MSKSCSPVCTKDLTIILTINKPEAGRSEVGKSTQKLLAWVLAAVTTHFTERSPRHAGVIAESRRDEHDRRVGPAGPPGTLGRFASSSREEAPANDVLHSRPGLSHPSSYPLPTHPCRRPQTTEMISLKSGFYLIATAAPPARKHFPLSGHRGFRFRRPC